jgi:hypothetical protein
MARASVSGGELCMSSFMCMKHIWCSADGEKTKNRQSCESIGSDLKGNFVDNQRTSFGSVSPHFPDNPILPTSRNQLTKKSPKVHRHVIQVE